MSEALVDEPKQRSKSSLPRSPPPLLTETLPAAEPLVICDHQNPDHPKGAFGCFRCIDEDLLKILLSMVHENKVKVFPAPVISIDIKETEKEEYLASYNGDGSTRLDPEEFFIFLHKNNICFKIFFTLAAFIEEHNNVEILKTIPSVEAVVGDQAVVDEPADVDEQAGVGLEEQPNFLKKFTTYYEYEYKTTDGIQRSCAFMLEFTNSVKILQIYNNQVVNKRIYIILNKFCNNKLTREQKLSEQFTSEIHRALIILNSHGYMHGDPKLDNIVECKESSINQYKLIDFGFMRKISKGNTFDIRLFYEHLLSEQEAAKVELQTKFKIIQKYYLELRKRFRFMITNYISEYLNSMCPKAVVSSSYKSPENGLNYRDHTGYPSATFDFESVKDFDECKKELAELAELKLGEKSLMATYSSDEVQRLYEGAANYETEFRKKIEDIETNIREVGSFLSRYTAEETRTGDAYEVSLNRHFTTLRDIFKFEYQEGGQIRYKSKRSRRKKNGTRTRTKSKSKSKSKNKRRTRRNSKSKSKSKSKNKRRTRRK